MITAWLLDLAVWLIASIPLGMLAGLWLKRLSLRIEHTPSPIEDHGEAHGCPEGAWSVGFNHHKDASA